jgi:ribosome-binding factor A
VSQRIVRVDALLREEIGRLLAKEVQDPGVGFVTVTEVEASPDLRHARVWVSVIGTPTEQREALRALGRAMPFVRHQLGARLRLKRIPDLHVQLDDSMSRGTRVLRILDELERGETPESAPVDERLPTPVARLPREGDAPEPLDGPGAVDPTGAHAERPAGKSDRAGGGDGGRARPGAKGTQQAGTARRRSHPHGTRHGRRDRGG